MGRQGHVHGFAAARGNGFIIVAAVAVGQNVVAGSGYLNGIVATGVGAGYFVAAFQEDGSAGQRAAIFILNLTRESCR